MSAPDLNLGFFPWAIVQCTLPHSRLALPEGAPNPCPGAIDEYLGYRRFNGDRQLYLLGHPEVGLPFGKLPRVMIAWLVGEHKRTGERRICLGRTIAEFMRQLGLSRQTSNYERVQEQTKRLFSSVVQSLPRAAEPVPWDFESHSVSKKAELWWDPAVEVESLFESYVELSESFVALCKGAVPVNLDTCIAFRSPLQIDLYCWLTYRAFSLRRPSAPIPWPALQEQFGHNYRRVRDFKRAFRKHMGAVLQRYPMRVEDTPTGVVLHPHPPHVPRRLWPKPPQPKP